MITLLLATMLAVQTPDPRADAERLARSGAYEEALDRFRSIAAANPRDLDAREWIARLHAIMGHQRQAEDVYRSILVEQPDRLDALVGLGAALTAQGRLEEARPILSRAEKLSPNDLEVLAAQGRLNLEDEQNRLALGYYGRATLIAPEQSDLRLNLEEAHRRWDHRLEATYFNEVFSEEIDQTQSADVALNFRVTDRLRAFGRGQQERRFSETDQRGGGGLDWRVNRPWLSSLQAHAMVGPGNLILPEVEVGFGLGWSNRKVSLMALGTLYNFDAGADMWAFGPAIRLNFTDNVALSASLMRTLTDFGLDELVGDSAGKISVGFRIHPRVWLEAGYAGGIEDFDRMTVDRLGEFGANTVSGTVRLDLRSLSSIVGSYEYQQIEDRTEMGRLTLRFIQRF
ncbi:MAG TPA: tetratricopeptide repeat protein [Vicinamibacterales bacterium]